MAESRDYVVLVKTKSMKRWRFAMAWGRRKFTRKEAGVLAKKLQSRGRLTKIRKLTVPKPNSNDVLIKRWLRGDLDFDRTLMVKLARVARDSKTMLYVNSGKRSRAEQQALWNKYGPPRAARPGTSRHETGLAADVVTLRTRRNIGSIRRIRSAMKKHGLCLPVSGEPWHVERGDTWRA